MPRPWHLRSLLISIALATSLIVAACIEMVEMPPTPTPVPTEPPATEAPEADADDQEVATEPEDEPEAAEPEAESEADTEAETEPEPDPFAGLNWQERGRLTILLVGTDAGPERSGARADTVMVASLNLHSGESALFGLPRNIGNLPLPDHVAHVMGRQTYPEMLFELYAEAQFYPDLAPAGGDPGMVAVQGVAEQILGIPIDYYAMVDMAGFVHLINALGGVTVNVPARIHIRLSPPIEGEDWRVYDIPAGHQHLDGHEAFAFARTRTGTSDYDRMHRQRCLVAATTREADLFQLLRIFPDLVEVIRDHLVTNVPLELLPDLVMLTEVIDPDEIYGVGFVPPYFTAGLTPSGYSIPHIERIQETVRQTLDNPREQPGGRGASEPFAAHC